MPYAIAREHEWAETIGQSETFYAELVDLMAQQTELHFVTGAGIYTSALPTIQEMDPDIWSSVKERSWTERPDAHWRAIALIALDGHVEIRRRQPNAAHYALVQLEQYFEVPILTQNNDGLHQRSGSATVLEASPFSQKALCDTCDADYEVTHAMLRAALERSPRCQRQGCCGDLRLDTQQQGPSTHSTIELSFSSASVITAIGLNDRRAAIFSAVLDAEYAHDATIVAIHPSKNEIDNIASYTLRGHAETVLPGLVDAVIERKLFVD